MHKFMCYLVGIIITFMLIHYWHTGALLFSNSVYHANQLHVIALVLIFFALNIIALVGFFQLKHWRTLMTFIAVIFSTIFFSTAYFFFLNAGVPRSYRPMLMIVENALLLFMVFLLRKQHSRA